MIYVVCFICGTIFVSYWFVVVQTTIVESMKRRRSKCDFCGELLKVENLIPIGSAIAQRLNSSCCYHKLPTRYVLFEWIGGLCFAISYDFLLSDDYLKIFWLIFLLISAIYDIEKQIVPNFIIICGSFWLVITGGNVYLFISMFVSLVLLLNSTVVNFIGGADLKIIFMLMYSFSIEVVLWIILYASLLALVYIIFQKTECVPFVPFLLVGYIIALIH